MGALNFGEKHNCLLFLFMYYDGDYSMAQLLLTPTTNHKIRIKVDGNMVIDTSKQDIVNKGFIH